MNRYDVVVHGAGMVGLLFAAALAPSGLRIAVLDAQALPQWRRERMEARVSAVTVGSERMLRALEVWDQLAAARVSPFRVIEAWDAVGGGHVRFDSAAIGTPHLGHIVENVLIQQVLAQRLESWSNVNLLIPAAITALELSEETAGLVLEDGRRLQAQLVVAADGAASKLRGLAEIAVEERAYGQRGVVSSITTEHAHGEVARQRFLQGGPLALLPLADGRCSIVWSLPEAEAQAVLALDEAAFCAALTEASAGVLGEVRASEGRAAFPLRKLHAKRYCRERLALIGDAAHVVHPLAGQGANLGFLDAAALAEEVAATAARGRDIGSLATLRRYERGRRGDNLAMQLSMDVFDGVFRSTSPLVAAARSLGFGVANRLAPLNAFFMRQAMGTGRELPKLARGA